MLCRAAGRGESRGGCRPREEMLIMAGIKGVQAFSSGAEWGSVSRLSHTLACSMLLELHKLPTITPGGHRGGEDRREGGGEMVKGEKSRTGCRADRHQEARGPGPDVGLQVAS